MYGKILVVSENPPETYKKALESSGIGYDTEIFPENYSPYFGLLLIGGGDISPALYDPAVKARGVNFIRDKAEISALEYFTRKNLPVLGICRGFQIINVFLGGTLKNLSGHSGEKGKDIFHPAVPLLPEFEGLRLINSYHRQCVDKLAPNATPVLLSPDGTVEGAFFGKNILGVQFHPERLSERAVKLIYGFLTRR